MIEANISKGNAYASETLYQYDYGQRLRIAGMDLPDQVEIHFSTRDTGGDSDRRFGEKKDGATEVAIPDKMLENNGSTSDYYIYAFVYIAGEESGKTVRRIAILVRSRPRPGDLVPPDDPDFAQQLINMVKHKADGLEYKNSILRLMSGDMELARVTISGGSGGENGITPHIGENGNWYLGEADTGVKASGSDGVTPHIGDNGNWYIGETDTGVKAEAPSIDSTLTESGKAADAKITGEKISELKGDLNTLRDQIGQGGSGSGVSSAMASSLWEMLKKCAYISDDVSAEVNAFKSAWGIEESGSDEPTTPPTLTSITVTWSSDSADVGTDPKTLISVVKANYSDGTSRTVTGYTVTPSALAEGANTVTVSYSGKTSTKTITGNAIVVPGEPTVSDNLIVLSECGSGTLKDGSSANGVDMLVTPYIKVDPTKLYYTNINKTLNDGTNTWNQKLELYTADQARIRTVQLNYNNDYGVITEIQDIKNNSAEYVRILFSVKNDNPYFGESGVV